MPIETILQMLLRTAYLTYTKRNKVSLDCFIIIESTVKLCQLFQGFSMDIRSNFSSSITPSTSVARNNIDSSSEEEREIPPSKKPTPDSEHSKKQSKYRTTIAQLKENISSFFLLQMMSYQQ